MIDGLIDGLMGHAWDQFRDHGVPACGLASNWSRTSWHQAWLDFPQTVHQEGVIKPDLLSNPSMFIDFSIQIGPTTVEIDRYCKCGHFGLRICPINVVSSSENLLECCSFCIVLAYFGIFLHCLLSMSFVVASSCSSAVVVDRKA